MQTSVAALLFLAMSGSGVALADEDPFSNFYVALDSALARFNDACASVQFTPGTVCRNTDSAVRLAAGYGFTPEWGVEASFANLGQSALNATVGGTSGTAHLKATAIELAATGRYVMNEAFAVIGKVGVVSSYLKKSVTPAGFLGGDASASRATLGFGVGGQVTFTRHTGLRIQYEDMGSFGNSATTGAIKVQLFSAGLVYRF